MSTIIILCCLFAIYEAVLGFLQVIGLQTSGNVNYLITGSFSNPGPYGGLIAVVLSILIAYLWLYRRNADRWYEYLSQHDIPYTPRLNSDGIIGNHWYYEDNPFYQAGYGLPNCTCYAWGRRAEILNKAPDLSTGNADTFWEYNQNTNAYPSGQTPKLGAIICWRYTGSHSNDGGHVGVVEQINDDGTIITSNSAYGGTFFYTQTLSPTNGYEWADYTQLQGFIYLPSGYNPEPTPVKRKKLPLYMMLRRLL